jgi:carbon monoxide dehydrogenase subunit G
MEMTGEYRIAASRERVWQALNDPAVLQASIPGCESIDKLSDTEMTARVSLAVGPVKAKFSGKVTLSDLDPPNGYTISGEGQGGVAGFGKGGAQVRLDPDGEATILRYTASATVGGKIAQLGGRLIDATAKKLADEFFSRFAASLAPPPPAVGGETPAEAAGAPRPAPFAAARLPQWAWIPILIAAVAVLLWLFA